MRADAANTKNTMPPTNVTETREKQSFELKEKQKEKQRKM
jgi:hypothetical protein